MAVWQFKIDLIPTRWLKDGHAVAELFPDDSYDGAAAWAQYSDQEKLEKAIDATVKRSHSWHPDMTAWGDEESSDIQLWRETGQIESLGIRFDLRSPPAEWFAFVVALAQEFELSMLVRESKQILETSTFELAHAASTSRAAAFVRDPHDFLSGLSASSDEAT